MTIDIEALIEEIDEDGSGEIELDEFKALLQGGEGTDDPTEMEAAEDDWIAPQLIEKLMHIYITHTTHILPNKTETS